MMNDEFFHIAVWGFEAVELQQWPADLHPVAVAAWPVQGPVLVHARAAAEFAAIADKNPLSDDSLMSAVLWNTGDGAPGTGGALNDFWLYFDEAVRPGDWVELRRVFACPLRARMGEAAFDLPARALAQAEAVAAAGAAGQWLSLPLAPEVAAHLRNDAACRDAFRAALAERLEWRAGLFQQPHAPEQASAPHAAAGQRASAVLRHVGTPLLKVILRPWWSDAAGAFLDALATTAQQLDPIKLLEERLYETGLRPAGAKLRRRAAQAAAPAAAGASILARLPGGERVVWVQQHREYALDYDVARERLVIGPVHDEAGQALQEFAVELAHGGEALWRGLSADGEVLLPRAELEAALQAGADQLLLWSLAGEDAGHSRE